MRRKSNSNGFLFLRVEISGRELDIWYLHKLPFWKTCSARHCQWKANSNLRRDTHAKISMLFAKIIIFYLRLVHFTTISIRI